MSDLPGWLRPLAGAVAGSTAEDFLRVGAPPAPPAGGRRSAVLILLGEAAAGPDVLLIERAERLRQHAGQPAFPGGAADPGDTGPVDTALRESAEEVGLDRAGVRVVALLPELYLPPTGFLVTPVLGWWHTPAPVGVVDPGEVARVERVPVAELVDPANRWRVRSPSGYAGPAFAVRDMVVWGFTAAVLDRLLELAGWAVPWDADDVRPLPQRARDLALRGVPPGPAVPPGAPAPAGPAVPPGAPVAAGPPVPAGSAVLPGSPVPAGSAGPAGSAVPAGSAGPAGSDDGPAAEDVLPADEHGGPAGGTGTPGAGTGPPGTVER